MRLPQILLQTILLVSITNVAACVNRSPTLDVEINGNSMRVPKTLLPAVDRKLSSVKDDSLRIEVDWPSMKAFRDFDDISPVSVKYRDMVSILIGPLTTSDPISNKESMRLIVEDWVQAREPAGEKFGLRRFVRRDISTLEKSGTLSFDANDLYIYKSLSDIETYIVCVPGINPEPGTAQAKEWKASGRLPLVPYCQQHFVLPGQNLQVQVSYRRLHLQDWMKIQLSVINLIQSFEK